MADKKPAAPTMSKASAAVAIARTEAELAALENEKLAGKRVAEIDKSIAAHKKQLGELKKVK